MKHKRTICVCGAAVAALCLLIIGGIFLSLHVSDGGFTRKIPLMEQLHRLDTVRTAKDWLGISEGSDEHAQLIQIYNSHEPLAQGYAVTIEDNWCAAFASAIAIECGNTDIVPTECGCQRQIGLWKELGRWEENDNYMPLPGDYIYYTLKNPSMGDSTAWSDHVGIVVGTWHGFIKVIEGNNGGTVKYRVIPVDDPRIRGFALPDYEMLL